MLEPMIDSCIHCEAHRPRYGRSLNKRQAGADRCWCGDGRARDGGPVRDLCGGGARENYRAELYPGDHAPFLGSQRFVRRMVKEKEPVAGQAPASLGHVLKTIASAARLDSQNLSARARTARMVAARDRFICEAVWEEALSSFRGSELSRMSSIECERGLQKGLTSY